MAALDMWKFQVCRDAGYSGHLQVGTDTLRDSCSSFLTFKLLHKGHMLLARFSPQLRGERASKFPLRPNCGYPCPEQLSADLSPHHQQGQRPGASERSPRRVTAHPGPANRPPQNPPPSRRRIRLSVGQEPVTSSACIED